MKDGATQGVPALTDHDVRLLQTFREIVAAGGLTAAERTLGKERSSISRQLKALEARLGGALCQRGPRGFVVTDFGRAVIDVADELSDAMACARSRLSQAKGLVTGEIKLGVADTCLTNPEARIVDTLAQFSRRYPGGEISLCVEAPARLMQMLFARTLHAAICGADPPDARLNATLLFREEFRLYVARPADGDAPRLSELTRLGYGAVVRAAERSRIAAVAQRLRLGRQANASGLEAVATLVATGRYAGLLPTHLVQGLAAGARFVEVLDAGEFALASPFYLLTERSRPESPVLKALVATAVAAHSA